MVESGKGQLWSCSPQWERKMYLTLSRLRLEDKLSIGLAGLLSLRLQHFAVKSLIWEQC